MIEHVTGQRFEEVVADRVFARAGMTSATYEPTIAMQAPPAVPRPSGSGTKDLDASDCAMLRAAGGVMTTVEDFARFLPRLDTARMLDGVADIHREPRYACDGAVLVRARSALALAGSA